MLDKQVAGLHIASQKKKQEALLKARKAIAFFIDSKQKITVRSVATKAGVSVSYIYKHPELAYSIQKLREQQKYDLVKREPVKDLEERVKILQQEKDRLAEELDKLKASIKQVNVGKKTAKYLQAENIKLTMENHSLKQDLEYIRQNLQQARKYILSQRYDDMEKNKVEIKQNIIGKISQE